MGSICSSQDEAQLDSRSPQDTPLILWGDITNSESRVMMTLLSLAKVRYEMQQVNTPVNTSSEDELGQESSAQADMGSKLRKEDYLEVPEETGVLMARTKRISGRSIYLGDREAFFKFISTNYQEIESQLMPQEQLKRLN